MSRKNELGYAAFSALKEALLAWEAYYLYLPMGYERDDAEDTIRCLNNAVGKYEAEKDGD